MWVSFKESQDFLEGHVFSFQDIIGTAGGFGRKDIVTFDPYPGTPPSGISTNCFSFMNYTDSVFV